MDKKALLEEIIRRLRETLSAGTASARSTFAAATDPDSKAENKYDTRNLEASYLARGQASRIAEAQQALSEYESMRPKDFAAGQPVAEGALVSVSGAGETLYYFIGPAAGGLEINVGGLEVTVITPSSPLGAKLMRRRAGEALELQPGKPASRLAISAVA